MLKNSLTNPIGNSAWPMKQQARKNTLGTISED